MEHTGLAYKLHYTLRIACAMCFIGHGCFGIITKPVWENYFAVFDIGKVWAYHLMPVLGAFDILLGCLILIKPFRIVVWWLVIWGLITAALRPLSGESVAEFIERAGNYGAPLALLFLNGFKPAFKSIKTGKLTNASKLYKVAICIRIAAFLLFAGHGWLNLTGKKGLISSYTALGFINPVATAKVIGVLEIIGGMAVSLYPKKYLILVLLFWKITSEMLYPHYVLFEWIERGGSYGILLSLWFIANDKSNEQYFLLSQKHNRYKNMNVLINRFIE